jgi:hypothetical protein
MPCLRQFKVLFFQVNIESRACGQSLQMEVPLAAIISKILFLAPDIFYDIDLNPKEEEVDGITKQESLTKR